MIIAAETLAAVVRHARESQPRECCGVLIGKADRIHAAIPGQNLAEEPSRFLLDPKSHLDARRQARAQHLDVVGFYHSHPHSRAHPSETDLAEANYPECVHLIVGFVEGQPDVRLFSYSDGRPNELQLREEPGKF